MLEGLHILLTYRCTHRCDHCFLRCSPDARGTFTLGKVRRVLDEGVRLGTVKRVYFEGGEPFLHYPLLLAGVGEARERGFEVGVVTNGYWAESPEDAVLALRPLAERGIADLSVSLDDFHGGEENGARARNAVEGAERLGMPVGTIRVASAGEPQGVRVRGRAAETLVEGLPRRPREEFGECPDEDLAAPGRVHLDAFGNVHLCQGLLMGNLWETPLSELVRGWDAGSHPVAGPLVRGGPAALVREHGPEVGEEFVSACHLCHEARKALLSRFPDCLGPRQVYEDGDPHRMQNDARQPGEVS